MPFNIGREDGRVATPPAALVDAWHRASDDLGFVVIAPYTPQDDPKSSCFAAKVKNFGSSAGTVVDWIGSGNSHEWVKQQGFYVSTVNAAAYEEFDASLFRETLDDWGWTGDGAAPGWYTGRAWS